MLVDDRVSGPSGIQHLECIALVQRRTDLVARLLWVATGQSFVRDQRSLA